MKNVAPATGMSAATAAKTRLLLVIARSEATKQSRIASWPWIASRSMNIWLHKQVMIKLAANGGKLPADIRP